MKKSVKIILVVVFVLFVLPVVVVLLIPDKEKVPAEPTAASQPEDPDAWKEKDNSIMARSLIEVTLKMRFEPRKVQFPGAFDDFVVRKMENQQYIISSYVDVQNDFGVMTRIRYLANMQQTGPGNNDWDLVSFELLDD